MNRPRPAGGARHPANRLRLVPRGFSLLELVIVVILVSLLFTVAVDRLLKVRLDAERVAIESTLGTLRSALGIEVASRVARGKFRSIADLEGSNPMDRLAEVPYNYIGVLENPDPAQIPGGQWYFEPRSGLLVYRILNADSFRTGLKGTPRARFRIRLVYADNNHNGAYDPDMDSLQGVKLRPVEPYAWIGET